MPRVCARPARNADSAIITPVKAMPGPKRRGRAWAPPPLERHRVERGPPVTPAPRVDRVLGKRAQGRSAPELRGVGRRRRLGHDRPGPQHGVAVAKERVRVRDPGVAARDHQDAFTLLGLEGANREAEPAGRGPGEILEQGARVCCIARTGPTGRPEHTVAQFGAAQRCVRDDRAGGGLERVAARLEDRATGKFRRAIPQHGPVREFARRGPTGPSGWSTPALPRRVRASRCGVSAASFAVRPPCSR